MAKTPIEADNHPIFEITEPDGREIKIYFNGKVDGCKPGTGIANYIPNLVQGFIYGASLTAVPGETARDRWERCFQPGIRYYSKSHAVEASPTSRKSESFSDEGVSHSSARSGVRMLRHATEASGEK